MAVIIDVTPILISQRIEPAPLIPRLLRRKSMDWYHHDVRTGHSDAWLLAMSYELHCIDPKQAQIEAGANY